MSIIDPEILKRTQEGTVIIQVKDAMGNAIGYKGRFLPHTYDNFTEALRENQKAREQTEFKRLGLNEHGQTKEQAKAFEDKKKIQQLKKDKAEMALIGAAGELRR